MNFHKYSSLVIKLTLNTYYINIANYRYNVIRVM